MQLSMQESQTAPHQATAILLALWQHQHHTSSCHPPDLTYFVSWMCKLTMLTVPISWLYSPLWMHITIFGKTWAASSTPFPFPFFPSTLDYWCTTTWHGFTWLDICGTPFVLCTNTHLCLNQVAAIFCFAFSMHNPSLSYCTDIHYHPETGANLFRKNAN